MAQSSGHDTHESPEARNERFTRGEITESEIQAYHKSPEETLFKTEKPFPLSVIALTRKNVDGVLQAVRNSWEYESDFNAMQSTFKAVFEQEQLGVPGLLNPEYYLALNEKGEVIAVTGIYTIDIQGGRGFATRDKLDDSHYLNARIGWTSVRKDMQGKKLAGFLIDWVEAMARSRGATHVLAEVDDLPSNEKMRQRYERHGYASGFHIDDYFGPGRHLRTYAFDTSDYSGSELQLPLEEVQENNKQDILTCAKENYSLERFDEFETCLDLFLAQNKGEGVFQPHSIHLQDADGKTAGYVLATGSIIYPNILEVHWYGIRDGEHNDTDKLLKAVARLARDLKKEIVLFYSDGQDEHLHVKGLDCQQGIPRVWRDHTQQLLYSKKLVTH
ncbi:MAG: GNAT family N-acetyltransferase [Patescibacteria group bacterium]